MQAGILDGALAWLAASRPQFTIVNEQSHPYYSIKPVAELAVAADVLGRMPRHAAAGRSLLEHAWMQLRGGALIVELIAKGPEALVQSAIYLPFVRAGLRNAQLDAAIAERARTASAVPPLHRLPIAATLTAMGLPTPWSVSDVIRDEWANRMGSPLSLSAVDLYMATHIAFYATDYGREPGQLAAEQLEYLRQWIPMWLDELGAKGQLDLLAELVIAAHCVDTACVAPETWRCLASAQRPDGTIPYQVHDQRQVGIPGMPPERERFLRDYHSTLVTCLACALCIDRHASG